MSLFYLGAVSPLRQWQALRAWTDWKHRRLRIGDLQLGRWDGSWMPTVGHRAQELPGELGVEIVALRPAPAVCIS